ncbi:phage major capsid protein [Prauserella endophytica]|uniref:Phage major capsid protein n=1 Tax=Prauserella endophytica TaxID=1592324 RepID=A0ABY2RTP2_9PSEU|nr:phage major capsid protein [Prauserella endophytica]TKG58891.1 phage major capsid protein [Prauserella endophytica]
MTDTMTVEERAARQSEIRARLAEIDHEHNGAELPEEVRSEWDELNEEHDLHERAIADAQARRERLQAIADNPAATERVNNRQAGLGVSRSVRRPENIYDLSEIRNQARSIDELPQLYRDNAMRAVESARFPGAKNREAAQTQVERLLDSVDDEQGTLARKILVTGSPTYDRAFGKAMVQLSTMGLTAEEQRALALGTDSAGGFAVPFQLDPTVILTSNGQVDPIRQVARVEQIVGKTWQGITSAGITVSRAAEAGEAGDNSPTLAQPEVTPTRVQGFVPFSVEIDQDWAAMRSEITTMLGEAKAEEEASSFFLGDGTGNNPFGVVTTLNSSSHVDAAGEGVAVGDIYATEEALPPRFRSRAVWMANRSIYNKVRQLDTQGGANLWVRLAAGLPPELIGYPAYEASAMDGTINPAVTGTNLVLLFGDFSKFLIVDRVGMSVELVPHLFGANRRPTGQRGIYAIWRNSSKILSDNAFRLLKVSTTL